MKFKIVCTSSLLGLILVLATIAVAQQRNAGARRNFPQPGPAKEVTPRAISFTMTTKTVARKYLANHNRLAQRIPHFFRLKLLG